jgi:ABC-type multidrug transport system ATPase subunit
MDALRQAADDHGVGVILVEQHVPQALRIADHVCVVAGGRMTLSGSVVEVGHRVDEAFLADVLRRAVSGDVSSATDCASLVEAGGGRVTWVEGDARLLKVTDAEDLALVESWLAE